MCFVQLRDIWHTSP